MMRKMECAVTTVLVIAVCFGYSPVFGDAGGGILVDSEGALLDQLMRNYHRGIRPAKTTNENITVKIGLSINILDSVDVEAGTVITHNWLRMTWTDYRLTWNASDHNGIQQLNIPVTNLWVPDIEVYNSVSPHQQYQTMAVVYSSGGIFFVPPVTYKSTCAFDVSRFPFDSHKCYIQMGSWTYDGSKVDLKASGFDKGNFIDNSEFDLANVSYQRNEKKYPCCEEPYVDVQFFMDLRRRTAYSTHLFVAPAIVTSLLMPCLFLIPPDSREKLVFGTGILIGHVLMFGQMMQFVPHAYPRMPVIGVFFLTNIILVCLSLASSILIVTAWNKGKRRQPVPVVLETVFLGVFGRLLCVSRDDYFPDEESDMRRMSESGNPAEVDKEQILQSYSRLTTVAHWRQLAVVLDRMLCIVFFVTVVIVAIALCRP